MIKREKFTLITFLIIFIMYNIIGYAFNVNELKVLIIHNNVVNEGFDIRFELSNIALFVPVITSYLIYYVLKYLKINE